MEHERYRAICRAIAQATPHGRRARQQYSDGRIVAVYFWAHLHHKPVYWACREENWPATHRAPLPSQSRMSRRLRSVGVLQLLERLQTMLAERVPASPLKQIDSKPLVIGHYSKDRDGKRGRAAGGMARGYKLHALREQVIRHWTLTSMNVNDQVPAPLLLGQLRGWGYVGADNGYDANRVHRSAAAANHQLVAPPRKAKAHVRILRRNSPARLRSLELCANPLAACGCGESFGRAILRQRAQIERTFGHLAMQGLYAPPPWVRRPHRVALWVAAHVILHLLRYCQRQRLTA